MLDTLCPAARRLVPAAGAALLLTLAGPFALGQQAPRGASPERPVEQGVSPVAVSEQLTIAPIGVTVFLPTGCTVETETQPSGRTTADVSPGPEFDGPGGWLIRIYNIQSPDETLRAHEVVDDFITRQTGLSERRSMEFDVVRRTDETTGEPLRLGENGLPAARFYSRTVPTDGYLSGYTIVRGGPGKFIVFQLISAPVMGENGNPRLNYKPGEPHFGNETVALYETVVASLSYEDPALARVEQTRRLKAGAELLSELDSDDIRRLITENDEPTFLRIYEPSETGLPADATEVAYQKVTFSIGQLGELEPERTPERWTPKQREYGYIVAVDAKVVERGITAETRARYFLSQTMDEEFWVTTTVQSRGEARSTAREVVIRRGSALTATVTESGQPEFTRDWQLPETDDERYYISRVEQYLLPYIVAGKFGGSPAEIDFAFYAYDSAMRRLTQRTDRFSNRDVEGWIYESQRSPDADPFRAVLRKDGTLVNRTLSEDRVMERTTRERLQALWAGR